MALLDNNTNHFSFTCWYSTFVHSPLHKWTHRLKHYKHMRIWTVLERATLCNRVLPRLNQRIKNKPISFCLVLYHPSRSFSSFPTQCWSMHFCLEAIPLLFQSQQPLKWRLQILQNSYFSSDENKTGTRQIMPSRTSDQSKSVMYCSFFAKGWDWGSFVSSPFVSLFFCFSLLCVGHVPLDGYCFQLFLFCLLRQPQAFQAVGTKKIRAHPWKTA